MVNRWALLVLTLAGLAGCRSWSADPGGEEKPPKVYRGLDGQLAGVMVWADWATRTEYPQVQLDLARALQFRLEEKLTPKEQKKDAPSPPRFVDPKSVLRFQREHPEIDGLPIAEVAPKMGIDRVIFIEVEQLQTQSPSTMMLLRGKAVVTLRVVEVSRGVATVALEERGIDMAFPPDAPEGVPMSERVTPVVIYQGLITRLADRLALRFAPLKD